MIVKFQHTVGLKIGALLFLVLIALLVNYGILMSNINGVNQSVKGTDKISSNSIIVLELNKDIVELQRDVTLYGQTGRKSIFDKLLSTHDSIKSRLNQVKKQTTNDKLLNIINNMQGLVMRYGENLHILEQMYHAKTRYIDQELPSIFTKGTKVLNHLATVDRASSQYIDALSALNLWLDMERSAILFLSKKQFSERRTVIESNNKLTQLLSTFHQDSATDIQQLVQNMLNLNQQYKVIFEKSIQANRNFLSLINIVMAGDAVEFSSQSVVLKTESLALLASLQNEGFGSLRTAETIVKTSIFTGMLLFFGFALFFQLHIIAAIKRLTASFQSFLKGDFTPVIADTNRNDEIGLLAAAANEFKHMNEDLLAAKQEAEVTSKIKSEFLANMSHEIRTPLNGILGMVSLLGKTELTTQQTEMVEVIDSSGKSLLVVLNDILDISKIESGMITLEQKPFNLNMVITELNYMFQPLVEQKDVELFIAPLPELSSTFLIGDVTRLKQILINLLSNAVKFTEVGSVSLRVETTPLKNMDMGLTFSIVDTGIGIAPENIETLFDAFSQADTSITRRFGGTGLGLTISNQLLALMNSNLSVTSTVGRGSQFSFYIELSSTTDIHEQDNQNNAEVCLNKETRILIVEDNKINQTVLNAMLKQYGLMHVQNADNGKLAVAMCKEQGFDLILMDMQMPVMDGITATKMIRDMEQHQETKIVALTANVLAEDKKACFDAGMNDFLSKPIEVEDLERVLLMSDCRGSETSSG